MELRGPESFAQLPELFAHESSRPIIILAGFVLKKRTILGRPEWKHIPWSMHPTRKTAEQCLMDIFAGTPDLLVDKYTIDQSVDPTVKPAVHGNLANKVKSLLVQLEQWEQIWNLPSHYEIPSPATTPQTTDSDERPRPIWPTVFQFESLLRANTLALFSAIFILLARLYRDLMLAAHEPYTDQVQMEHRIYSAGISICRSVDYHIGTMRQGAGMFYLMFPIRMAYAAVGSNPAVGDWIRNLLHQIASGPSGRWSAAKYLLDMPPAAPRSRPPT